MGNNVDLCAMLGLPSSVTCPKCCDVVPSYFDDYDIDCGEPFPKPGFVSLSCYCQSCLYEWAFEGHLMLVLTPQRPKIAPPERDSSGGHKVPR